MTTVKLRLKKISTRLLLMLVPALVLLLLIETVLRIALPTADPIPTVDDGFVTAVPSAEFGWIFPADTTGTYRSSGRHTPLSTNAWGLRSGPVDSCRNKPHLLLLGDSYAFGWGVAAKDGFGELATDALTGPVALINGALPGYAIYQQIRMLEFVGDRCDVRAVVATISLANDFVDEERIRRFAPDNLETFDYGLRDPRAFTARLIAASRILTVLDERTVNIQFSLRNARGPGVGLALESMGDLAEACRSRGLPLVWVVVPRAGEIRGGGAMTGLLNRDTARLRERVLAWARELHVPALDLLPVLTEAQRGGECYLPGDAHWNERGHRAVAEALSPVLKQVWITPR